MFNKKNFSFLLIALVLFGLVTGCSTGQYKINKKIIEGEGNIKLSKEGNAFKPDTKVDVEAVPAKNYKFSEWQGNIEGKENPYTVTIPKQDITVGAVFKKQTSSLNLETVGQGYGSIKKDNKSYKIGEKATLTAKAEDGYKFSEWQGDIENAEISDNQITLPVKEDTKVKAEFDIVQNKADNVDLTGNGTGTIYSTKSEDGEEIFIPKAARGSAFVCWENGDTIKQAEVNNEKGYLLKEGHYTAIFAKIRGNFAVDLEHEGGKVKLNPEKDKYKAGDSVTITANPKSNYNFSHWQGDIKQLDNKTKNKLTLVIGRDIPEDKIIALNPVFNQKIGKLNLNQTEKGTIELDSKKEEYKVGDKVTLTANPAEGYTFDDWSGDISGDSISKTITVEKNMDIIANFEQKEYTINISEDDTTGKGKIKVNTSTGFEKYTFKHGETVELTAIPSEKYMFKQWKEINGKKPHGKTNKSFTFEIKNDLSISAEFKIGEYEVNTSTSGKGSVTSNQIVNHGDEIELTAEPAKGYTFDHWSGDISGDSISKTITVTENMNITANFEKKLYTINTDQTGTGSVSGGGNYKYNEEITLTANPTTDKFKFDHWEGDLTGTNSSKTITVTSDMNITAVFTEKDSGIIKGTVTNKYTGNPIENVNLTLSETGETVKTDSNGQYILTDVLLGEYTIEATLDSYNSSTKSVNINTNGETKNIDIQLESKPLAKISGIVKNSKTENGIENIMVEISGRSNKSTTTNANGEFEISGLIEGDYTISYSHSDYQTVNNNITLNHTENKDLETIDLAYKTGSISGVTNANTVEIQETGATSDVSDGNYSFSNLSPNTTYTLKFKKTNYHDQTKTINLNVNEDKTLSNVELEPKNGSIEGDVSIHGNQQIVDAPAKVKNLETGEQKITSDTFSSYSFNDIEPGTYTLEYSASDCYTSTKSVEVKPNQTTNIKQSITTKKGTIELTINVDVPNVDTAHIYYSRYRNSEPEYLSGNYLEDDYEWDNEDRTISVAHKFVVLEESPYNTSIQDWVGRILIRITVSDDDFNTYGTYINANVSKGETVDLGVIDVSTLKDNTKNPGGISPKYKIIDN